MNSTPRPETAGDRRRRTGIDSRVALALAAVGGVLLVAVAATRWGDAGSVGAWTAAVSALTGGAGLAARDEDGDAIERLTAKINRARAGEDVSFATDRDDEVGDLYAAAGRLAAAVNDGADAAVGGGRDEAAAAGGRDEAAVGGGRDDGTQSDRDDDPERHRRRFAEITSDPGLTDEEKTRRLLALGCERLGVEYALVTRIDEETGHYEVETVVGTDDVEAGDVADLSETFCRKTMTSDGILGIYDATAEGFADDPAYAEWGVGCYVGGKLLVGDEVRGTVCFVAESPRETPFTHAEKVFVDLVSRWIGHATERRETLERLRLVERAVAAAPVGVAITDHAADPARVVRVNDAFEAVVAGESGAADALREDTDGGGRDDRGGDGDGSGDGDGDGSGDGDGDGSGDRDGSGDGDWWSLLGEWAEEADVARLREAVAAGNPTTAELRIERSDGGTRWVRVDVAPVEGAPGPARQSVWFFEDVTERTVRERELERTRDMLEQSQRLASVGAWEMTVDADDPGSLADWSAVVDAVDLTATAETYRIFGAPLDRDLSPVTGLERFHPEDRERVRQALERSVTDGRPFEFEARLLGDWEGVRWVRSIGEPVTADAGTGDERADATDTDERVVAVDGDGDRVVAVRGSIQDITESKTFERQVVERERDLAEYTEFTDDVLDALDDVFYVIDEDGHLQRWNETLPAVTGYDDATLAGMDGADFFGEDRAPEVVAAIEEVFETGHARVELPLLTSDGDAVPYEFVATRLEDPDGDPVLAGIGRDVSERRARERELAETKRRLEIALEGTNTGIFNWNLDTDAVAWDETAERILGLDPGEFGGTFDAFEDLAHPEDLPRVKESAREAIERDELYQAEFRMEHADGSWVWVEARGHIVTDDDGTRRMVGINHDVTDRKEHELAMESLHETARGLLGTESRDEAAALVLGAAEELLDPVCAGVYLLEDGSNRLEPVATTSGFGAYCREDPVVAGDDSLVWNCYLTGTPSVVDAGTDSGDRQPFGEGVGGVVLPLGDHGVFVVGTTAATVDEESRRLVETLAATAEAAFDRIETETALRERDVELAARNRRLQRQVAITEVIRRVDRSLVGASSREEIEAAVCDRLAGTDDVAFAWIGGLGAADERLDPRAWAGAGEGYLDAVDLTVGPAAGRADSPGEAGAGDDGASGSAADALEPAVRVVGTREPAVVGNVVDQLQTGSWAKSALACDLHSVVAVPLVYEGYFYGVLGVYASEPDAFGDLERTVFAELGESIAHSINAVETQRALHADALVELRLRVPDADDLFGRLARETGGRVAFEGLASHSESESRLFLSAAGVDAAAVAAVLDDRVSVREFRLVDDDGERALFEVVVEGETIPSRLVRHGASPRSLVATGADLEAVVDVPTATDVREFLEMLRAVAPDVELTGRRTVERAPHTRVELAESFLDALTDRQLEVLRTAYFAGFFDWPRTSTGEDVAAMLGVTQPTVNRHLRLAQRRLFAQLFGDESVDAPDPIDAE